MSKILTRRAFLRGAATAVGVTAMAACQPKIVEVTKIVEKPVEKVVKEVVKETVIVAGTPQVVEKEITRVVKEVVKETVVVEKEAPDFLSKADDTAKVSAAGSGEIVLEYWNGLTGEDGITMIKICQQWAEANPEVAVKMQRIPWGNYFDKLLPAIVAGAGPDIFILHRGELHEWKPKGVLKILDELFDAGTLPRDDFNQSIYDDVLYEGHVMGVPLDAYGPVLWLNLDMFDKAGIEFDPDREPLKRDEFLDIATQMTWDASGRHPDEAAFDPENVDIWGFASIGIWGTTARQNGVDRVSIDGSCVAQLTDPGIIDALTFERDLRWRYHVQPVGDFSADQAFAAQKLAMFYNGSWFYNWFRDYPNFNKAAWYFPQFGAEKGVWCDSHCLCLPLDLAGDKLEWSMKLIPTISGSHLWAAEAGMPTPRKSVGEHPQIAQNWALPMQLRQQAWIQPPNRSYPCGTEVGGIVSPAAAAVLNNEVDPLEAMQEAQPRVQQVLDRCCQQ